MDHHTGPHASFPELRRRIHTWIAKRSHTHGTLDKAALHYARAAQASQQEATRQEAIDHYWQVQSEAKPVALQVMEGPALVRRLPVPPEATVSEIWQEAVRIASTGTPTAVETQNSIAQLTRRGRLKWRPSIPSELLLEYPSVFEEMGPEGVV